MENPMSETVVFQTPFVCIKKTQKGFFYLERKGVNSVAIFLIRKTLLNSQLDWDVLIRYQPLPIDNSEDMCLFPCPITGGIEPGEVPQDCADRETFEEAGYSVETKLLCNYVVGTQTNEIVSIYWADVTDIEPEIPSNDGTYFESISNNQWEKLEDLKQHRYSACKIGYLYLCSLLNKPA
jgi:hypothetical protein